MVATSTEDKRQRSGGGIKENFSFICSVLILSKVNELMH